MFLFSTSSPVPLPPEDLRNSVLRHVHEHVVHLFIPCLGVCVSVYKLDMDVVDSQGYFKMQSIIPVLTQLKLLFH